MVPKQFNSETPPSFANESLINSNVVYDGYIAFLAYKTSLCSDRSAGYVVKQIMVDRMLLWVKSLINVNDMEVESQQVK